MLIKTFFFIKMDSYNENCNEKANYMIKLVK